jgi:hypothetical protein
VWARDIAALQSPTELKELSQLLMQCNNEHSCFIEDILIVDALPESNRPQHEAYHSPPSCVEIKNECSARVFYSRPTAIMAAQE